MAVYSEIISDEMILSSIPTKSKNILIVACGGCMNESLAFKNNSPIFVTENDELVPYASKSEAERIMRFLSDHGFSVRAKTIRDGMPVLCIYSEEYQFEFCEKSFVPDAVLALCCEAGILGLGIRFVVPVIPITQQLGYLAYTYKDSAGKRNIIRERSKAIFFKKVGGIQ